MYNKQAKSPTYNIISTYKKKYKRICHIDLYRLNLINDIQDINIKYYYKNNYIILIEWGNIFINFFNKPKILIYLFKFNNLYNRLIYIITNNNSFTKIF